MPLPFQGSIPSSGTGPTSSIRTGTSMPDLPSFQVVPPNPDLRVEDFRLPDGSPLIGPNGYLVPPAREFSMVVNAATRMYSYRFDEAMRDNWVQARAMRRDAFIRALLEERMLPTINRKWQIEVDDDRDPNQRAVRDAITKLVQGIPDLDAFTRALVGDGCWYGRAGVQWNYWRNPEVDDLWSIKKWDPVHGDSIQFTYDGVPAVLMDAMTAGWYSANGATQGQWGDIRSTDRGGMALVLQRPTWRNRFAIYQHIREKADYFEGELAGSVQGLGLRGLVYWQYLIRTDALTWMLAYMQSVGQMDMLIFNYPWGNDAAKNQQQANANKIIGKAAFIVPRNPQGNWNAVEQLSMNDAGLKALHSLISEYFDRNIERLVVGQSMSAGADNESGLGGTGRADFAKKTKDEILVYDTGRRDQVMTRDVVGPLKAYNFKWARFPVRFKSVLPDLEAKDKVASGKTMVELRVPIKIDELREAAGFSRPEEGDDVVQPPPDPMAAGMPPGVSGAAPQSEPGELPEKGQQPPEGGSPVPNPTPTPQPPNAQPPFAKGFGPSFNSSPAPIQLYDAVPAQTMSPHVAPYFPGGSNTYIPRWDERETVGFTRLSKGQDPTQYRAKLGCVMVSLQGQAAIELLGRANLVRDCDLAEDGREESPHVTVRWGFRPEVITDDVETALRGKGPFELTLGKISCFYGADTGEDYDVVKVDVTSPQLRAMNGILGELPCETTHREFRPHATIAYVKAGLGDLYKRLLSPVDLKVVVDELEYSDADKAKSYFRLTGPGTVPAPAQYARDAGGREHKGKGAGGGQFTSSAGANALADKHAKKARETDDRGDREGAMAHGEAAHRAREVARKHDEIDEEDEGHEARMAELGEQERRAVAGDPRVVEMEERLAEAKRREEAAAARVAALKAGKPSPVSPTTAKVLSRLPRTAYSRLASRVTKFEEAPSVEAVTDAWYAGEPNPPPANKRTPCFGFYDPADGRLLVGPGGPNVDQQGTLAHELGHALDQSDDRRHFQLSGDPEFVQAWEAEMGRGQLSNYARTDEVEGFAEFCRLLFGTEGGMEKAREQFPRSYAYFARVGLVS